MGERQLVRSVELAFERSSVRAFDSTIFLFRFSTKSKKSKPQIEFRKSKTVGDCWSFRFWRPNDSTTDVPSLRLLPFEHFENLFEQAVCFNSQHLRSSTDRSTNDALRIKSVASFQTQKYTPNQRSGCMVSLLHCTT